MPSSLAIDELLAIPHPVSLGAGTPNKAAGDKLGGLVVAKLFAPVPIRDMEMARACLAGLWLRFDYLDESHTISQGLHGETGSFWHAIMHRREGDFSNAKYWYARCANHPILPSLSAQASAILNPLPADKSLLRLTAHGWNPNAFVDFVEALHRQPSDPRYRLAVALQQLEWRVLFDHCTRAAAAGM